VFENMLQESDSEMERLGSEAGDARGGRGWVTVSHCGMDGKRESSEKISLPRITRELETTAKMVICPEP